MDGDTISGGLPDPDRAVVTAADNLGAIRRKRHAVDVLAIALEDARWSAGERPQTNGAIPGCGGERLAVGGNRKRDDRCGVAIEHAIRRRLAWCPDRDMRIAACGHDAAVFEPGDRIHRT